MTTDLCWWRHSCLGSMACAWEVCLAPVWVDCYVITGDSPTVSRPLPHAETCVDLHVNCPLVLSDFYQKCNVLTYFSKTPKCETSCISDQRFSSCYMQTYGWIDRRGETNRHIFRRFATNACIGFVMPVCPYFHLSEGLYAFLHMELTGWEIPS
jgi:hypothetical protein